MSTAVWVTGTSIGGFEGRATRPGRTSHATPRKVVVGNVALDGGSNYARGEHAMATARARPSTAPPGGSRDFTRLNRAALRNGLVTAKEQRAFREANKDSNFARRPSTACTGRRSRAVSLPGPDHVYGMPSHKPTKGGTTARVSDSFATQAYAQTLSGGSGGPGRTARMSRPTETRTVALRRKDPPRAAVDVPAWQLSQFDRVAPAVSTFRSEGARERALRQHEREKFVREGTKFGMGIAVNAAGSSRNL